MPSKKFRKILGRLLAEFLVVTFEATPEMAGSFEGDKTNGRPT
jgi:hypothetical protein